MRTKNQNITGMNLNTRILEFNIRWNIQTNEVADYTKFINRVLTIVDKTIGLYILNNHDVSDDFALLMGYELDPTATTGNLSISRILQELDFKNDPVYKILRQSSVFLDFVEALQKLFWILEKHNCPVMDKFTDGILEVINLSPGVNIDLGRRGKRITIYPTGSKLLDENLINETLKWLEDWPKVAKPFEESLNIYLQKDEKKYRNLLDNLRFALEELLKDILHNKKPLEKQKSILLSWLNGHNINQDIINMYSDLLDKFIQYQNNSVKHSEKWLNKEIEFIIYLTGSFLNFLIKIERQ